VPREENSDIRFRSRAAGDPEDEIDDLVLACRKANLVEPQKYEAGGEPGALVAIDERVILREVEEVRGRLLVPRCMQFLPGE